jgi:simple sugar transport system permease protein
VFIFASADALQIRAQALGIGIPYQFLVMLPYLVTLIALAGFLRPM